MRFHLFLELGQIALDGDLPLDNVVEYALNLRVQVLTDLIGSELQLLVSEIHPLAWQSSTSM